MALPPVFFVPVLMLLKAVENWAFFAAEILGNEVRELTAVLDRKDSGEGVLTRMILEGDYENYEKRAASQTRQ